MFGPLKSKLLDCLKQLFSKENENKEKKEYFDNGFIKYSDAIELDKPIECDNDIQSLFEQIYPGDIVYAHMPLCEEELDKIPEGHKTRPYFIAYKLNYGFIAFGASSSPYEGLPDTKTYSLSDVVYSELAKSSYLDLNTAYYLPKDKLIRFICETKKNDFNEIQRRLWIGKRKDYETLFKEKPVLWKPIPGDIINRHKEQWLIVNETENGYDALEISKNNGKNIEHGLFVHCNSDVWKIDFTKGTVIEKSDTIKTQHIVNKDDFYNLKRSIEAAKKASKKKKSHKNKSPKYYTRFNIGTVFKDIEENEEYVYLYSNKSYDYCIKVSEYLNSDVYPEYTLYETRANELTKNGEVTDDELKEILKDQINYSNDKFEILKNRLKEL